MSKKSGKSGLGKAIIKDKNKRRRGAGKGQADSWLHSSEIEDGYEWGRLNLRSVTEESKLDEFLNTAKLAGTEFIAEKLNIKVVDPSVHTGLPSALEYAEIKQAQNEYQHYLSIPRRPKWDLSTTAEELDLMERDSFLEWRRSLVKLEENEKLVLTPFERNLEFWRQLWRVIERSDVVVQIVDARNPLLFRSEDLEKYVKEINPEKANVLLISKADLLTFQQRQAWYKYFAENSSLTVVFWSATKEIERLQENEISHSPSPDSIPVSVSDQDSDSESLEIGSTVDTARADSSATSTAATKNEDSNGDIQSMIASPDKTLEPAEEDTPQSLKANCQESQNVEEKVIGDTDATDSLDPGVLESELKSSPEWYTRLLTGEELVDLLLTVSPVKDEGLTTVGMVGYPNVGKSSTINALIQTKKVPVSATPGRTKHFQTLYLSDSLLLCDCPGLVFPTFVSTKAEMVCSGILPIDQMRDHIPPISLVCSRIPRPILEGTYGIRLPHPREGDNPDRYPYAEELCGAYGYVRGYMTSHGQPDGPRSARYILKDYVNGRLLYCHPPPGTDPAAFNLVLSLECQDDRDSEKQLVGETTSIDKVVAPPAKVVPKSEFDAEYFHQAQVRMIKKGVVGVRQFPDEASAKGKHWKKHNNHNKKEKTRRAQPALVY